jgi:hypothetical protein
MLRQGLEAGEHITFFEPKPKDEVGREGGRERGREGGREGGREVY